MGLREHPKFVLVQILAVVRAEALAAGATLAGRGQLESAHDVWHFGLDELALALDDASRDLRSEAGLHPASTWIECRPGCAGAPVPRE
jgi:hypothetical protein